MSHPPGTDSKASPPTAVNRSAGAAPATTCGRSSSTPSRVGTSASSVRSSDPSPPPTSQTCGAIAQSTAAARTRPCRRPPAAMAPSKARARSGCAGSHRRTARRWPGRTRRRPTARRRRGERWRPPPRRRRRRSTHARQPPAWSRRRNRVDGGRPEPAAAVEAHPAAGDGVAQQPLESIGDRRRPRPASVGGPSAGAGRAPRGRRARTGRRGRRGRAGPTGPRAPGPAPAPCRWSRASTPRSRGRAIAAAAGRQHRGAHDVGRTDPARRMLGVRTGCPGSPARRRAGGGGRCR